MRKVFIGYLVFLFACADRRQDIGQNVTVFRQFPEEIAISFDNYFPFEKRKVRGLFISDSSIFVSTVDGVKDHFYYEYDLLDAKLKRKFIEGGHKKGQGISAYSFGIHKKRIAWIHDVAMNKVITADLGDTGPNPLLPINDYTLKDYPISAQLMDSSRLLTHGMLNRSSPYKMQLVNLVTGETISEFGEITDAANDISVYTWKNGYAGFLFLKPEEDKAVLACRYADQIEIFDLVTKKSIVIKGPENYKASFAPIKGTNNVQRTPATRFAFMSGVTNSKHIYLLYSGENQLGNHPNQAKYIYVYDWNGHPVKKITLDRYVSGFTISEDEKNIYAFDLAHLYVLKSKKTSL